MGEDNLLHQGEAKASAADFAMRSVVHAEKFGKKERHGVGGNTDATIADRHECFAAVHAGIDLDLASLGGILHRIGEEIRSHLAQTTGVSDNGAKLRIEFK